jgi:hypothetical protein
MFDPNVKPNNMSYEEALQEFQSLKGIFLGTLDDQPEIFFSSKMVAAMEIARYALMQPERQETQCEVVDEPSTMTVNAQCMACGIPCSTSDNYCPHCGRRLKGVVENGCTKE